MPAPELLTQRLPRGALRSLLESIGSPKLPCRVLQGFLSVSGRTSGTFVAWRRLRGMRGAPNVGAHSYSRHQVEADQDTMEGTVSVVTGASRGIGKGIAMQLAKAGSTVYITGRD